MGCKAPQHLLDGAARLHPEVPPGPRSPTQDTRTPLWADRQTGRALLVPPQASILLAPAQGRAGAARPPPAPHETPWPQPHGSSPRLSPSSKLPRGSPEVLGILWG